MGHGRHIARATLLLAAALAACGTRGDAWTRPLATLGPVAADGRLVWLQRPADVLTALDPLAGQAIHVDAPQLVRALQPVPGGVLVAGGRGDDPVLARIVLPDGTVQRLPVAGVYDALAVSPGGRYAVAYRLASSPAAPGGPPARNNNEIAVADLERMIVSGPLALQTETLAPVGVVFSPDQAVAAVLLDSAVVFVLLGNPEVRVTVPLKLPGGRELQPAKALFAPDGAFLYVFANGSDDVLALEVRREGGALSSAMNFLFFPGASGLRDILVPAGDGFERYVAALYRSAGGSRAVLLDATGDTSRTRAVSLQGAPARLADLGGGMLLAGPAGDSSTDRAIAGWDALGGRVDEDRLPFAPRGEPRVAGGLGFFARLASSESEAASGTSALTAVRVQDDGARIRVRLNPLQLSGGAVDAAVHPADDTLFVAVTVARKDSGAAPRDDEDDFTGQTGALVSVQPGTLALAGLALDDTAVALGVAGDWVWALHRSTLGDVTFVPRAGAQRSTAVRFRGFLAGRLLDRGEED